MSRYALLNLDEVLTNLAAEDTRNADLAKPRFLAGLSIGGGVRGGDCPTTASEITEVCTPGDK